MKDNAAQLCEELVSFGGRIKFASYMVGEAYDLSSIQLYIILILDKMGPTAMGQAARMLHCDASNVTSVVDRLVARGLVQRQESARDRRAKILTLTGAGKELIEKIRHDMPTKIDSSRLTPEEMKTLRELIVKITIKD